MGKRCQKLICLMLICGLTYLSACANYHLQTVGQREQVSGRDEVEAEIQELKGILLRGYA